MTGQSTVERLLPVFIGVALTGLLLIVLGVLAARRRNAAPLAQPINLIVPIEQQAVDSPLVVRFTTPEPLSLHPTGWGTDRLHLHARVSGVEYMPAAAEITRSDSIFNWTLPAVPRGTHTIRIGWADLHHRELSAGRTPQITITVR
ncbi:MAG TPA: hypothetical protein VGC44_10365 [Longimicrobiales bacterium]